MTLTKKWFAVIYIFLFALFLFVPIYGSRAVTAMSDNAVVYPCVVIDAGHGGVDGGAVSCTGIYESQINLQIATKLNDLFHLMGVQTRMIRDADISVYTEGKTIAAKKVSDIKERIRIANTTPKALYLSIHQNHFSDSKYHGSQVFYNAQEGSKDFAEAMQRALSSHIDSNNRRQCKRTSGIYLMEHINCPGILIECGFLSNPAEEERLRDPAYQNKLCCVIAATTTQYQNT